MRFLVLLAAALTLGGCTNMVMSEKPLFSQADGKGAPAFRQGVWAAPDPGCEADLKTPFDTWPKCAHGDLMGAEGPVMPGPQMGMVLVQGDPVIVQFALPDELRKAAKGLPGGGGNVFYSALKPLERDDQGRVTVFEGWLVTCGPPPATQKTADGAVAERVTEHPLPGLKIVEDHCMANRAATVRAAAAASRGWQTDTHVTRWIRDGDK